MYFVFVIDWGKTTIQPKARKMKRIDMFHQFFSYKSDDQILLICSID